MKTRRFFREWEKENLNSDGKKKTGERMKQTFQCQCWQTLATNWRAELLTKKMWPTLRLLSSVFYPLQKLKRTGRVSLLWLAGGMRLRKQMRDGHWRPRTTLIMSREESKRARATGICLCLSFFFMGDIFPQVFSLFFFVLAHFSKWSRRTWMI